MPARTMMERIHQHHCAACNKPVDVHQFSDDRNLLLDIPRGFVVEVSANTEYPGNGLLVLYFCENHHG